MVGCCGLILVYVALLECLFGLGLDVGVGYYVNSVAFILYLYLNLKYLCSVLFDGCIAGVFGV